MSICHATASSPGVVFNVVFTLNAAKRCNWSLTVHDCKQRNHECIHTILYNYKNLKCNTSAYYLAIHSDQYQACVSHKCGILNQCMHEITWTIYVYVLVVCMWGHDIYLPQICSCHIYKIILLAWCAFVHTTIVVDLSLKKHGHLLNLLATPVTLCKGWQSGSKIPPLSLRALLLHGTLHGIVFLRFRCHGSLILFGIVEQCYLIP